MFDRLPPQFWLLIAIAAVAWAPALYVYRYIASDPTRGELIRAKQDLSWRRPSLFARNLALSLSSAALAVFIFTPAAARFARSPAFMPMLLVGFGGFALFTVFRGFSTGNIEPLARGLNRTFSREPHPKRFWASMVWNGLFGLLMLLLGVVAINEAPFQALEDQCYDPKNRYQPSEELASCNQLLDGKLPTGHSRADVIAARGSAYYRQGDLKDAEKDYLEAVRLRPDSSANHYNLGLVDSRFDAPGLAVDDFTAAIRADGTNYEAYVERGSVLLELGKLAEAIADFSAVLKADPGNAPVRARRGLAYVYKGNEAAAERDFVAARAIDPADPTLLHGEAFLAFMRGHYPAALSLLTAELRMHPDDEWALELRRQVYAKMGRTEEMQADQRALDRLDGAKKSKR